MKHIYPPFEEIQLLTYLQGKTGEEESSAIRDWVLDSDENRRYLDKLESVWLETGKISPDPVAVDVDAAWERMLGRISHKSGKETPVRSLRYVWTAAAVLLVSFGLYFVAKNFIVPPAMKSVVSAETVLKDTLSDGTVVSLNRNSSLTYPEKFRESSRSVKLKGEAFFEVTHQEGKSFLVEAGAARIQVLGTSFNVKAYPGADIEVSVEQGTVRLFTVQTATNDTLSVSLGAGERGILRIGSEQPELLESSSPDRLYWLDKTLEFRQTELSGVFNILTDHFGIHIHYDDPSILQCRLSATFRDESLETIMEVIATSFGLGVTNEGTAWYFHGKGCSN